MPNNKRRKGADNTAMPASTTFVPKRVSLAQKQGSNVIDDDFQKMETTTV
eukprot:CAMPEP_0196130018 /NCGR_PEP_ID=MMETSP0910-20130528/537_1 /TAXON_ID=49265 /ORGANISM="Thalassiosira rotula, Strain GSO102" /LENGTH=49 /DNA_ID= /DNA_START= /DNA_END= /DNA_ORIENTATION=